MTPYNAFTIFGPTIGVVAALFMLIFAVVLAESYEHPPVPRELFTDTDCSGIVDPDARAQCIIGAVEGALRRVDAPPATVLSP